MKKYLLIFLVFFLIISLIKCSDNNNSSDADIGLVKNISLDFTKDKAKYSLLIIASDYGEPYKSARLSCIKTLKQYGLIIGKNLSIEYHCVVNDLNKAKQILKLSLKKKPDAVLLIGTIVTIAAKER